MTDITREEVQALAQATERQIAKGPRTTIKLLREQMASVAGDDRVLLQSEIDEEEAEERKLTIIIAACRAFAKIMDAEPVRMSDEWPIGMIKRAIGKLCDDLEAGGYQDIADTIPEALERLNDAIEAGRAALAAQEKTG